MQHEPSARHTVYLALGANLGDRRANLSAALAALPPHVQVLQVSHLFETEPAYVTDQPRFLNAALCGATALAPAALLARLKQIEQELGRAAGPRFGPRPIDLDILLYDDLALDSPDLTIPHPRMAERPFVLVPLAQIAPGLTPPGWGEPVAALARRAHTLGAVLADTGPL